MEEFRSGYVEQVGQQLKALPRQQKETMLNGLRQELEENCVGFPLQLLPSQPPEEVARELIDAVDPAVRKRHSTIKRRLCWCILGFMVLLLIMAICCMCYIYYMIQQVSGSYSIITIQEYRGDDLDQISGLPVEWAAAND